MNLEVEAKFQVDDLTAVRDRLIGLSAILKKERIYEKNTVYDDAQQTYKKGGRLIRLRQDEKVKLTFKGEPPAAVQLANEAKVREEIELEILDFDKMEQILDRLGLQPALVYEKYRETWQLGDVEVVLDELPYGNFVELEGEEADIKRVAADCDLDWHSRLNTNYLALLGMVKQAYNLDFQDLTFSNFDGIDIHWGQVLSAAD